MKSFTKNLAEKINEFCDNKENEEMPAVIYGQEDEKGSDSNSSNNTNSEDANKDNCADCRESLKTDARKQRKKKIDKIKVQIKGNITLTE